MNYGQCKVEEDLTANNQKIVKDTIQNLIVKQELPATATNLSITTPRTSCIYFLPKIHKPNNPGRPIVSACSCPTELISSYLDKIMAPIVKSLPSYIKDSQHALEIFRDFNFPGQDKPIFTMDISSLYTCLVPRRLSFFRGTRARAKDQGKGKRRETSGRSCFQNGGKCNGGRLCNIPK